MSKYDPEAYQRNKEKRKATIKKWRDKNRDKVNATVRKYRKSEKFKNSCKAQRRKHSLKTIYGITLEDYDNLYNNQEGKCAICSRHQTELKRPLSVDHCHKSGIIRGLLCDNCNMSLGLLKDNIETLQQAIKYLKENDDSIKSIN